jgi:hypothetical protein
MNKIWYNEIIKDNIKNNYLTSLSHHILITPFISNFLLPDNIASIIKQLETIDNLWLEDINTFKYRELDINQFLINWSKMNQDTKKINNDIVNISLDFL